jgi:hypothetical protein
MPPWPESSQVVDKPWNGTKISLGNFISIHRQRGQGF